MKKDFNLKFCIYFTLFGIISCSLHPVVFIPGDGGSQLEAKLNKSTVVHYLCEKSTSGFFNIWLNLELLVPVVIDCWVDNVKLNYDNVTRKTFNQPGVDTRIPGFGSSETVEWLDPSHASTGAYFKYIGDILVKLGLERNITIKGAPYDFRKAPNENQEYFEKLKNLIETTYQENGNQSVMLIAHSMGGPMSLQLLSQQKQSWKDKYIKCLITLAGAWGGSVKAVKVYAIGDDLGSYALRETVMKQEQISSPSLAWMLPNQYFWDKDEVLVQTSEKNFSLSNIEDYFRSLNFPNGWEMRKDTLPYQLGNIAPGVEVHCLFGVNISTVERLYYKPGTWLDGYPTLINGDGDGTVNRRSLEGCLRWSKMQSQPVYYKAFPKVDHMGILKDQGVLNYISNLFNSV